MLWIEGRAAPDLAEEYGTPLYVTSEAQIRANVRRMREAFESRWPRVTLLYRDQVERQPGGPACAGPRRRGR